ncbi:CopG family transcriptional regulator [Microbacterium sp. ARD32]|uniref:ribbon-helix-helix domain-containing protein n=1 Tax=Microbacterium sp. ARD32 TaxID=2962577 RepID=UPI0028815214|nr:CopG family transcriptional regulator [Microbacterium sp. ARD32]MDT0158044.1 CopG family transcriptional regulator [Microbacterium sp. ARD32]
MAMNLRLRPEAAAALKAESERTGLSQQEILRRAVDEHLGLAENRHAVAYPDWVIPPDNPPRVIEPQFRLAEGMTVLDLIDREDRV